MQLRIEGTLSEVRETYLALTQRGFKLSNPKVYANAKTGEERRSIKRQIPPFFPSQITDELIQEYSEREFRLYCSVDVPDDSTKLMGRHPSPRTTDAVLGSSPVLENE